MATQRKEQRKALLAEAIAREPRILKAKKFLLLMCGIFLAVRLLFVVVETAFVLDLGESLAVCALNYAMLLVGVLFAFGIYAGGKPIAFLAMFGGFFSVVKAIGDGALQAFSSGNNFAQLYVMTLFVAMGIQVLTMVVIVLNANCKVYFEEIKKINIAMQLKGK